MKVKEKKVKVVSLSEMVPGILKYIPGMEKNEDLARLKRFVGGGRIPVNVDGFTITPSGRSLSFSHESNPGQKMFILERFLSFPEEAKRSLGYMELFPYK